MRADSGFPRLMLFWLVLALAGCASAPPAPESAPPPVPTPEQPAGQAAPTDVVAREFPGAETYNVMGRESLVRILAYRAGTLKSAGHNHLVASHDLHGLVYLHEDVAKSGFDLVMPVNLLEIDNEELRRQEGPEFAATVSDSAREGTRKNMLGEAVLDGERYPAVTLSSVSLEGTPGSLVAHTRIRLKDQERELAIPVVLEKGPGHVIATGEFDVRQTEFGMKPFSVMMGAVQVADVLRVKFRVVAVADVAN
jgi:polyisoprenoid-binding protein YceI